MSEGFTSKIWSQDDFQIVCSMAWGVNLLMPLNLRTLHLNIQLHVGWKYSLSCNPRGDAHHRESVELGLVSGHNSSQDWGYLECSAWYRQCQYTSRKWRLWAQCTTVNFFVEVWLTLLIMLRLLLYCWLHSIGLGRNFKIFKTTHLWVDSSSFWLTDDLSLNNPDICMYIMMWTRSHIYHMTYYVFILPYTMT